MFKQYKGIRVYFLMALLFSVAILGNPSVVNAQQIIKLRPGIIFIECESGKMGLRWLDQNRKTLRISCNTKLASTPTHSSHEKPTTTIASILTLSPTFSGSPTITNRGLSPTLTPTTTVAHPPNGNHNGEGFGVGRGNYGTEVGINLDRFNQIKAEIAQGRYARPCTNAEHDRTKWHSLVNVEANCHYDHHHGDDPSYVNDIFGTPGEWFGNPGQSISYPWQTFRAMSRYESNTQALANREMENDLKHEGYVWIVRRNQPCPRGNCITDFRLQVHAMMGAGDFPVRWHSFSIEERVCIDASRPETCGIYRKGGWADTGRLFTTANNVQAVPANCGNNTSDVHVPVPADNLLWPLETFEERPWDEIRCHPQFNPTSVPIPTGNTNELARWWSKPMGFAETRFQVFFNDPVSMLNRNNPGAWQLLCAPNQPVCHYTASILSAELGYIHFFRSYVDWTSGADAGNVRVRSFNLDPDGNGIIDNVTQWVDRWGDPRQPGACTSTSLDCIPSQYRMIRLNGIFSPGQAGYVQTGHCKNCEKVDHDISPPNSQWVTWFYRHAGIQY